MDNNGGLIELVVYGLPCLVAAIIKITQKDQQYEKTEKFSNILNKVWVWGMGSDFQVAKLNFCVG